MSAVEALIPLAAVVVIAVIVGLITRLIATAMLHKTIREAMKSDPASVPLLAERLEARQPWADAVLGWIFIAFAVALALLAVTEADAGNSHEMLRAAIVPLVIGATVLLYTWLGRPKAPAAPPAG